MAALPITKNLELSIIIVSFNDRKSLAHCLNSLYDRNRNLDFETIVINNGQHLLTDEVRNKFSGVIWVENKINLGFAKAVNQGIKISRANYILSLNSDTVILDNSLLPLVKFMDDNKKAACVGGMMLNPRSLVQSSCRRFPNYANGIFNRSSFLTRIFPDNRFSRRYLLTHWNHENIRRVDWVCGAYMMLKKDALKDVGLMDENYFMYCEDLDWCYRANKKGWKVYYNPQAKIIHNQMNGAYFKTKLLHHHKSMLRFYKKSFRPNSITLALIFTGMLLKLAIIFPLNILHNFLNNLHKTLKES